MRKTLKILSCLLILIMITSCAHQSKVKPSKGHIDGKMIESKSPTTQAKPTTDIASSIPKLVKNSTYLPPPKPKAKAQTYSVVVNEVPVKEILFALARESKLNVDIHPSIQGRVTLNAVDQTLPAILERLAKQVDLTYKVEGNVMSIMPDMPVLRTYKVDYVNMSRDTSGFVGVDGQISAAGQSTGAGGASSTTSGNGASNSSRTSVTSESKSHFWETLEKNIKDILAETDKEVIVTRTSSIGNDSLANTKNSKQTNDTKKEGLQLSSSTELNINLEKQKEDAKNEYKTLFAATVIVNREAGVMSVRGTNKQHEKIQEFLGQVMNSAKRQVLIEATIVEVQLSDVYKAGVDWSRLDSLGGTGLIFSQSLGPQIATGISGGSIIRAANSAGLVAGYVNGKGGILSSLQLLQQFGDTKVLSSPKLMVLNNQTAVLKVVNNLVYFTVQAQQSQGAVGGGILSTVTTTPNTVPVGVVMSVTPQINETGSVNINVRPTVSRVVSFKRDPNPNLTVESLIPEIQVREMESMLQINSGNTAVLGGLMQDDIQSNTDKVPVLGDVPVAGKLFTGKDNKNAKTELVIFLRPTVIPNASLESDELNSFKQFLPNQQLNQTVDEPSN